jgi:hypothetical protein
VSTRRKDAGGDRGRCVPQASEIGPGRASAQRVADDALHALLLYYYPGDVRELEKLYVKVRELRIESVGA